LLLLTDLDEQGLRSLDWPTGPLLVKPRLTKSQHNGVDVLRELFPAPGRVAVREVPSCSPWLALALVDRAEGSQYDALLAAARGPAGAPGPVAAVALTGSGFHGNRGRPWQAVRGNLHLSCSLPVDLAAGDCLAAVPAIPVVAVGDALASCAPDLDVRIKWVNDLLVAGAKVAGVLAAAQSRGDRVTALTYGVGVNVAVSPPVAPTLFVPRVTCLHDHPAAREVTVARLGVALLAAFGARLAQLTTDGPQPVVDAYRQRCGDVGRRVRVWAEGLPDTADPDALPPPVASGRVEGLTGDLGLLVAGAAGPLHGGRLAHLD
jgi:BirA family biotin operon repressor/biotin-[acetyl-CoA-carboxylase] ligase